MKPLWFTVPLLRLVILLDSLKAPKSADPKCRNQATPISPGSARFTTLVRLVRIVTPLEAVLPQASSKAPARPSDNQPLPPRASQKKTRTRKGSRPTGKRVSSRKKK